MKVRDIVWETGIKTIPMEKECKKAKWLSEKALQIDVKWRDLNVEFQRTARRDKKVFLRPMQRNGGKQQNGKD